MSATRPCSKCGGIGYQLVARGETAGANVCECMTDCARCGGARFVLGVDGAGYEVAEPCACVTAHQRVRLYNEAGIPASYAEKSITSYHARGHVQNVVKTSLLKFQMGYSPSEARGVMLVGPPGRGKTHLVTALLNYFTLQLGIACRFVDFFHLTARIRATYDRQSGGEETEEGLLAPLVQVPVLAIDELGKGRGTSWELGIVDQIISRRYNAGRTVLVTTNYQPQAWLTGAPSGSGRGKTRLEESLEERVSERIVSRLMEMCDVYRVDGVDYRAERLSGSRRAG